MLYEITAWFEYALRAAEKLRFVSGYRFSDTANPSKSSAPLGAERRILSFPAASSVVPQRANNPDPSVSVLGVTAGITAWFEYALRGCGKTPFRIRVSL
jgi:hypothetical protein